MKAEDIESALAELEANPQTETRREPGPSIVPFVALVPRPSEGAEPPEKLRLGPDPAIPGAYQVAPAVLLGRCSKDIRNAVSARSSSDRYGALLLGASGCGKSSAAAWAMRRWRASRADSGETVRLGWLDALEATDAERRYKLGSGDPAMLSDAYRADWLVLDDVGLSSSVSLVQLVLARRYQACLPTIVTTGLEREQLVNHIGAASVRRIVEFEGRAGIMVDCHRAVSK